LFHRKEKGKEEVEKKVVTRLLITVPTSNVEHTIVATPVVEVSVDALTQQLEAQLVFNVSPLDYLKAAGVTELYHFTDARNRDSIMKHGLFSWVSAQTMQGAVLSSNALSRRLDADRGVADFVRLCFKPDHPMLYIARRDGRIMNHIWLRVKLDALKVPGVKFCDTNAAKAYANVRDSPDHIHFDIVLDRQVTYFQLDQEGKSWFQAEVLVPRHISPEFLEVI